MSIDNKIANGHLTVNKNQAGESKFNRRRISGHVINNYISIQTMMKLRINFTFRDHLSLAKTMSSPWVWELIFKLKIKLMPTLSMNILNPKIRFICKRSRTGGYEIIVGLRDHLNNSNRIWNNWTGNVVQIQREANQFTMTLQASNLERLCTLIKSKNSTIFNNTFNRNLLMLMRV